ncbi:FG-GAP-like repeat-containing protein [Streptomyces sp. NPDC007355]|uniref:FG-GAP-like repeat-containing protein n=1 Tax=Streptomyces sp. NPDC007355 TaxID=3364778 RepID=UPI00369E4F0B
MLVAGVVSGVVTPALADTGPPVLPKPFSLPGGGVAASAGAKAGYLPGSGSVSPDGAFNYSIPLDVPAGRAGMAPRLSLQYSSGGGDGVFGLGWSLSGAGGSIRRCGNSFDTEGSRTGIHYDETDKYCLDGMKLILTSGTYGASGSEYRTENDSFAKVIATGGTAVGGPDKFVVFAQNGHIFTYEARTATRTRDLASLHEVLDLADPGGGGGRSQPLEEFTPKKFHEGLSTPRVTWVLTEEADRSGNKIGYEYDNDVIDGGLETRLTFIKYTYGNNKTPQRRIEFKYEDRPDHTFNYANGVRYAKLNRVSQIDIFAPNPATSELVRSYKFSYLPIGTSEKRSRSLLSQVQECGAKGGCLPAKKFSWSNSLRSPLFDTVNRGPLQTDSSGAKDTYPAASIQDVNDDGADDLIYSTGGAAGTQAVRLGELSGGIIQPLKGIEELQDSTHKGIGAWPDGIDGRVRNSRPADLDGDGKNEYIVRTPIDGGPGMQDRVLRWDNETRQFMDIGKVFSQASWEDWADFNGDGLIDRIGNFPHDVPGDEQTTDVDWDNTYLGVQLNTGSGKFTAIKDLKLRACRQGVATDFNGDGRADYLYPSYKPSSIQNMCGGQIEEATRSISLDDDGNVNGSAELGTSSETLPWTDFPAPPYMTGDETRTRKFVGQPFLNPTPAVEEFTKVDDFGTFHWEPSAVLQYWKSALGDFNGDGLQDVLVSNSMKYYEQSLVLWNTGNGLHWDGTRLDVPHDAFSNIQVGDMNGDGRDDIVSFHNEDAYIEGPGPDAGELHHPIDPAKDRITIHMPTGGDGVHGTPWARVSYITSAGKVQVDPINPRPFSRLGDFNGDGRLDILKNDGELKVMTQRESEPDKITAVSDEGAGEPRQEIEYSHTWAEKANKIADNSCTAPLACIRKGMPVVRKITSHEDSYKNDDKTRSTFYSYQAPVSHVRQGFLGFGTVRSWDPARGRETVTTYDLHTSAKNGKVYPFASAPKTVTVTAPVLTDDQVAAKPSHAKARITKTTNTRVFKTLNRGKTYTTVPQSSVTTTADADVTIDWTSDHVTAADRETHLTSAARAPFSTVTTIAEFDDFGNQTRTKAITTGTGKNKTTSETVRTFDTSGTRISDWLISVPASSTVTSTEALGTVTLTAVTDLFTLTDHGLANGDEVQLSGFSADAGLDEKTVYFVRDVTANTFKLAATAGGAAVNITADATADVTKKTASPVTRHTDHLADTLGRVYLVEVEKDNPDPDVRSSVVTTFSSEGVPTRVVSSAPGRPDKVAHTEYDPVFTGQPDEDIYPSQVWSEHTGSAYRPSVWSAVQPAYGITVASMDINGVQAKTTFDDLGRTLSATADGAPQVDTAHTATTDSAGKVIGTLTTTTTRTGPAGAGKDAVTKSYADQIGRTRFATVTGFNGETITTSTTYDRLGRTATVTRPTKTATTVGENHTYYDTLDRVIKTVSADNKSATTEFPDPFTTTTTDTAGHVTDAVVDNAGRVIKTARHYTKADGTKTTAVSRVEYGAFGVPVKSVDDHGNAATTSYDILGRPLTVTDPDRGQVTTSYYGDGLTDTLTHNGSNNTTTYGYDDLGRTISRADYDDSTKKTANTSFIFDTTANGAGQLAIASHDNGGTATVTTALRYDTLGRAKGSDLTVDGTTYAHDTGYDSLGRTATVTYPQAGTNTRMQLTNTYNDYGYLTDTKNTTGTATDPIWHAEERNADLALTTAKLGSGADITQSASYDPVTGRLANLTTTGTATGNLQNINYTYYDNGYIHTRTQNDLVTGKADRTEAYTYDDFNRLHTWSLTNGGIQPRTSTYDYNTIGNLTKVANTGDNLPAVETRIHGAGDPPAGPHALTSASATTLGGAETYLYDKQGRLIQVKDATGKTVRDTVFNTFDLPKTVTDQDGKTTSYLYDAFGTRVKKTDPDNSTTVYADGFEKRTIPDNKVTYIQYLPGGIGQAVTTGTTTTLEYTLTDALGSTGATTDKTGSKINNSYFYDPYGQPIAATGVPQTSTPGDVTRGFTGHEMENSLRTINMNGRTYDPAAKTFHTPDPVVSNHPYTYVNSSPITHTDPTGYDDECFACDDGYDTTTTSTSTSYDDECFACNSTAAALGLTGTRQNALLPVISDQTGYATPVNTNECFACNVADDDPTHAALTAANDRVGYAGDNSLISSNTDSLAKPDGPGYNYAYTWPVGSRAAGDTPRDMMTEFQKDPSRIFPFTLASGDRKIPNSPLEITLGAKIDLINPQFESFLVGKGFPAITHSGVEVTSVTPESFTFNTLENHFDGPNAKIDFSLYTDGDKVMFMQRGYAPNVSDFTGVAASLATRVWSWRSQAISLSELSKSPQGAGIGSKSPVLFEVTLP